MFLVSPSDHCNDITITNDRVNTVCSKYRTGNFIMIKSRRLVPTVRLKNLFRAYRNKESTCFPRFTRRTAPFVLILVVAYVILSSICFDTMVGSILFKRKYVTERELDEHLRHLLPQIPKGGIPPPSDILLANASTVLKPTMGEHRPEQDAIFAIADGLELKDVALFIVTLRSTGFEGDIVLSTWPRESMPDGVFEFLEHYSKAGLVIYENVIIAHNEQQLIHLNEVNRTNVWLRGLYGQSSQTENGENEVYFDPRPARSLGIARFEVSLEVTGFDAMINY